MDLEFAFPDGETVVAHRAQITLSGRSVDFGEGFEFPGRDKLVRITAVVWVKSIGVDQDKDGTYGDIGAQVQTIEKFAIIGDHKPKDQTAQLPGTEDAAGGPVDLSKRRSRSRARKSGEQPAENDETAGQDEPAEPTE